MIINQNPLSLRILNKLEKSTARFSLSASKISSGLRIMSAKDDAAGLAISEKIRGQIRGLSQAQRNIQDGISFIQTADGAMAEIQDQLQRMRELAVQSVNDTLNDTDRLAIQDEVDQIKKSISHIKENTQFNEIDIFEPIVKVTVEETWSSQTLTGLNPSAIWDGNQYIGYINAGGPGGAKLQKSSDGINWEYTNTLSEVVVQDMFWNSDRNEYILVGGKGDGDPNGYIATSADGINWTEQTTSVSEPFTEVNWNGSQYVAITYEGANILTSSNGVDWTAQNSNTSKRLLDLNWNGSQYVISAYDGVMLTSDNGIDWDEHITANVDEFPKVAWNGDTYAAAGSNGWVLTSTDGENWSQSQIGSEHFNDIIWTGNQFVAVGARSIISSADGATWDVQPTSHVLNKINWDGNQFIAIGDQGVIITSTDGLNWNEIDKTSNERYTSFLYNEDRDQFIAFGEKEIRTLSRTKKVEIEALTLQVGANENQLFRLEKPDLSSFKTDLPKVMVHSRYDSTIAIEVIDDLIQNTSTERGKLGAYENALNQISNNAANYAENLTTSESRIRDADIAKEAMDQTKESIISQAAQAMLAQSNKLPEGVLQLLR
ncbi:flagellin [Heyndrickxia sp. MSNUG]|uniref:flagellin N-terminal helical domain-containing protein n=1 Tax=Heyndrickxia sp. MSNUG TaxID=3136677 RepID=UPI003C2F5A55